MEQGNNVTDMNEFEKYAVGGRGINSLKLYDYASAMSSSINPCVMEERKLNVTQIDVFSRLMMDRIIFLGCQIDDDVANIILAQMLFLSSLDPEADIKLYVNTPGGQVSSGLAIYDTMQIIEPDVATICTGTAASMGAILLCAGSRGKRSILQHSKVMIHQPIGGVRGSCSDIRIASEEIHKAQSVLCGILAEHTGNPMDKILKDIDRDYWMTSDEALHYGIVDAIHAGRR